MSTVTTNEPRKIARAEGKDILAAQRQFIRPEVNVFETNDEYIVEAEMPGVSKDGLEVTLEGAELTILGRRGQPETGASPLYRESSAADYRRVFEIDPAVDTARIEARIEQGVLRLALPKSEAVKPRKVVVE